MRKLAALCLLLPLAGCSLNRAAARATSGVVDKGLPAVYAQSDVKYAEQALPGNLQLMEILLQSDPGNGKLLVNAAQGFCGYALMFLEDEDAQRATGFYRKGEAYAARALGGRGPAQARKADAPALFWQTFCRASRLNINRDDPEALAELPELEPALNRLLELDPGYYHNGAETLLGSYYAIRPKMFGGDPAKAARHFELALKGEGGKFLLNKYMYARLGATAALDDALFDRLLGEVLNAGPSDDATRLPDEVAKLKAKKLLERKNELF